MEQGPTIGLWVIPPKLITPQTDDNRGSQKKKIKVEKAAIAGVDLKEERVRGFAETQAIEKGRVCEVLEEQYAWQVRGDEAEWEAEPAWGED